jgi:hypothetical protein
MSPAFQLSHGQLGPAGTQYILAPRGMSSLQSQLAMTSQALLAGAGGDMLASPQAAQLTQDPASGFFYSSSPFDPMGLSLGGGPLLTYATMEQSNVGMYLHSIVSLSLLV